MSFLKTQQIYHSNQFYLTYASFFGGEDEGGRQKRNAGSQTQPSDLNRFCLVRKWETVALQNQSHLSSTQLKFTMSNINLIEFLYRYI